MIATTLGWGLAAVLWILGARNLADWFPSIEDTLGRELYFSEKAKLAVRWPALALMGIFSSKDESDDA